MMPMPEDIFIRVDVPEPYIPPGEQDAAVPCEYRPTRKRKCTSKSSSEESGEWDAIDEEFVLEEPPSEVPHTQSRTPSATVTCGESSGSHELCGASVIPAVHLYYETSVHNGVSHQAVYPSWVGKQ